MMKKVYFILIASASLVMASCAESSDYAESQPVKQEAQMVPQAVQELVEKGGTLLQATYPYTFTVYTIDNKTDMERNTVYFYSDAELTTPMELPQDMECKYKIVHCGLFNDGGDPEIISISESKIARIPKGSSSYVLFEKLFQNTWNGYIYHNYVLVEGVRYVNM